MIEKQKVTGQVIFVIMRVSCSEKFARMSIFLIISFVKKYIGFIMRKIPKVEKLNPELTFRWGELVLVGVKF